MGTDQIWAHGTRLVKQAVLIGSYTVLAVFFTQGIMSRFMVQTRALNPEEHYEEIY